MNTVNTKKSPMGALKKAKWDALNSEHILYIQSCVKRFCHEGGNRWMEKGCHELDLEQEICLKLIQGWEGIRKAQNPEAYFVRTVNNFIKKWFTAAEGKECYRETCGIWKDVQGTIVFRAFASSDDGEDKEGFADEYVWEHQIAIEHQTWRTRKKA